MDIVLFCLVKDGSVVFGPRRYHKPAFVKALTNNGIDLELPESVDAMTSLADGYSLVPEHEVATVVQAQVVEPEPEVDEEVAIKPTKKRKSYGSSYN